MVLTMYQELHRWEDAIEVAEARVRHITFSREKFIALFLATHE